MASKKEYFFYKKTDFIFDKCDLIQFKHLKYLSEEECSCLTIEESFDVKGNIIHTKLVKNNLPRAIEFLSKLWIDKLNESQIEKKEFLEKLQQTKIKLFGDI